MKQRRSTARGVGVGGERERETECACVARELLLHRGERVLTVYVRSCVRFSQHPSLMGADTCGVRGSGPLSRCGLGRPLCSRTSSSALSTQPGLVLLCLLASAAVTLLFRTAGGAVGSQVTELSGLPQQELPRQRHFLRRGLLARVQSDWRI